MTGVLVVDDEVPIRRLLRAALEREGWAVHEAGTGADGLAMVIAKKPDVVLLDLGLPDRDGAEVLAELRTWSSVPVIVLTVRNAEEEIVRLLDAGADDYVLKPFATGELIARLRVAIRHRAPGDGQTVVAAGRLVVDLETRSVTVDGAPVKLTPTEYGLLRLLVQHPGRVLTHRQILREVWGPHAEEDTNYLRVFMTGLRKKIEADPHRPALIITEPGVGYRFALPEP